MSIDVFMKILNKTGIEIIGGFVTLAVLIMFADKGLIPESYILLYNFLSIVGIFVLIDIIPIWSMMYLGGWIISIILMFSMGFIDLIELIFYGIIFLVGIYIKFK